MGTLHACFHARVKTKMRALVFSMTARRGLSTTLPIAGKSSSGQAMPTYEKLAPTAQEQVDGWLDTNKRIVKRPMSPHLSVYKWSIPMTFSAIYRVTSVFPLSAVCILFPLGWEAVNLTSGAWDPAVSLAAWSDAARAAISTDTAALLALKVSLVGPLVFHIVNGCRHFMWDQKAKGIRHLSDVYSSGNIVAAVTLVVTALLVALKF